MKIKEYLEIVSKRLQSGISREHSYRGDLETLIRELVKEIEITNEPANVTDCGNPDYVITKENIPVGYKTQQPLAMKSNPECMMSDVVESYRAFYQTKQERFKMVWSKRPIPEWFVLKTA